MEASSSGEREKKIQAARLAERYLLSLELWRGTLVRSIEIDPLWPAFPGAACGCIIGKARKIGGVGRGEGEQEEEKTKTKKTGGGGELNCQSE
jgi:hypothetical protein